MRICLIGVSSSFAMMPALKRYTDLAIRSIIATSLGVITLVSISGVTSSALAGNLDWNIALPSGGALVGMVLGRLTSSHLARSQLQKGFAAISAIVAIAMGGKVIRQLI